MISKNYSKNWDELSDETKTDILNMLGVNIKEKYFEPKFGETFYVWFYSEKGTIEYNRYSFNNSLTKSLENRLFKVGLMFKTIEEAMFAGNCDCYTKRFETYIKRHTEKLDWENVEQEKFYVFYSNYNKTIIFDYVYMCKTQGTIYASSKQILEDAVKDIGEDNFLKYVMKIEN